jgi:acyl-CoA reductase-like NAD-dependent aldehyde dehydrogenase
MDIEKAVSLAREASEKWKDMPLERRIELFEQLSKLLEKKREWLSETIMKEIGKPRIEAETEIDDTLETIRYFSEKVKDIHRERMEFDSNFLPKTEGHVEFVPYGVVGIIMP